MNEDYRILPSDREEMRKEQRKTRLILIFGIFISLALFAFPLIREYRKTWVTLKAARKLSEELSEMKLQAMVKRIPMEALFHEPDLVEFRQVSSCGPNATSEKVRELKLSELEADVVFLGAKWVEENLEQQVTMIRRYCYDPMYGSSLHADGLAQGSIFLAHQELLQKNGESFFEPYTEISVNGPSADTQIH